MTPLTTLIANFCRFCLFCQKKLPSYRFLYFSTRNMNGEWIQKCLNFHESTLMCLVLLSLKDLAKTPFMEQSEQDSWKLEYFDSSVINQGILDIKQLANIYISKNLLSRPRYLSKIAVLLLRIFIFWFVYFRYLIRVIIKRVKWLCNWPWLREYEMLL